MCFKKWNAHKFLTPAKGERKKKEREPKSEPKMQPSKVRHNGGKGTNYVSDSPPAPRSISQKEMEAERA
jgi:hypothetical protein